MYKVLLRTVYNRGSNGVAVSTEVAYFSSRAEAETAINEISAHNVGNGPHTECIKLYA
jgi:hypothetical protein